MKKIFKTAFHVSSILSLAAFVFLSGLTVRFTGRENSEESGLKKLPFLPLGIGMNKASADVPYAQGSYDGGGWGGDGCAPSDGQSTDGSNDSGGDC